MLPIHQFGNPNLMCGARVILDFVWEGWAGNFVARHVGVLCGAQARWVCDVPAVGGALFARGWLCGLVVLRLIRST